MTLMAASWPVLVWRPYISNMGENQSKTSLKIRKRKQHTHTQLDQVLCLQLFHFSNVHIITTQTRVSETWGCKCAAHVPAYMYNSHFYFKRVGRPSRGVDSEKLQKRWWWWGGRKEELRERGSLRVTWSVAAAHPQKLWGIWGKKVIYTKTQRIPILFPSRYLIEGSRQQIRHRKWVSKNFFFSPFLLILTVY